MTHLIPIYDLLLLAFDCIRRKPILRRTIVPHHCTEHFCSVWLKCEMIDLKEMTSPFRRGYTPQKKYRKKITQQMGYTVLEKATD